MSALFRICACLLLFISLCVEAQTFSRTPHFDAVTANKTLAQFNVLSTGRGNISQLKNALHNLTKLIESAQTCVSNSNNQLEELNKNLTTLITPATASKTPSPEQKYLGSKKDALSNQLSECQLFLLHANEVNMALNTRLKNLVKSELFYSEPNVIESLQQLPQDLPELSSNLNIPLLNQLLGLSQLDKLKTVSVGLLLLIGLMSGFKLRNNLRKNFPSELPTNFASQLRQNLSIILQKKLIWLIPITLLSLFFTVITPSLQALPGLAFIGYAIIGYLLFMITVRFIFYSSPSPYRLTDLPEKIASSLIKHLRVLAWICLISYTMLIVFRMQNIPDNILNLFRTLVISAIVITLISITWLMRSLPKKSFHFATTRILTSGLLILIMLIILVAQWLGYHLLANYLLYGSIISIFAIFITRLFLKLIDLSLENLSEAPYLWQQKLKKRLGLKRHERLMEALWLRMLLYFLAWCCLLLLLLKTWGLAPNNFQLLTQKLLYGINIGKLPIVPSRIALGILFFIILSITTRWIRNYFIKNTNLRLDQGNREALASVATYIGFVLAVIIALLIAGVNFSGLAIVAGALSVGIGFGLQNIVSNFVSGIILLIERPIKPGDRIIVDDTEGYVRRISIRATHIITLQHADVIVPNSDLIAKQVTNYMLYDTNYTIIIPIGIEYDSDTNLAKSILLEIATKHPQVINTIAGKAPQVYFKNFGDNSLDFELWCLIADVNSKGSVTSDLHFAIEQAFRKHNIRIAFPQREVTIRNWTKEENNKI